MAIDDPGDFRRGNHWQATPDGTAAVTFAAGETTATLSIATRDDWRDIPDNTITATILPSQDGSYRPASASEGEIAASFAVTDNDVAPALTLAVTPERVVEGGTLTFTITRTNAGNTVHLPLPLRTAGDTGDAVIRVCGRRVSADL